ncbi:MAG: type IX secretion system membrane protein PorP/SprF [Flavobacteriales bacterium]|nr:type IX secretion system membrane protein PorP/SprF [Flavobacteriales bacterium]
MKALRYLIPAVVAFGLAVPATAQQLGSYTQYMLNPYSINPGAAGSKDYYQLRLHYRNQWVGITDSPKTYSLSYFGRKPKNERTGLGVTVFSDKTGPSSRTGFQGTYTHHLKLGENLKLGLGLGLGMVNYSINTGDIYVKDKDDLVFTNGKLTTTQPDGSFGAYMYSQKFYLGFSVQQLLASELNWAYTNSKMAGHQFIMAGYKFKVKDKMIIEPSVLVRHVKPVPMQLDMGITFDYMDRVKFGAQYRTKDAVAIIVGYNLKRKLYFGYSYDMINSALKSYTSGTHEIMLSYRLVKIEEEESQMTY